MTALLVLAFALVDPFCDVASDVAADLSPFCDAAPDAAPDAAIEISITGMERSQTPNAQPEERGSSTGPAADTRDADRTAGCDNLCRVARRSDADTSNSVATSDTGTRPFKRRGIFRRIFSR